MRRDGPCRRLQSKGFGGLEGCGGLEGVAHFQSWDQSPMGTFWSIAGRPAHIVFGRSMLGDVHVLCHFPGALMKVYMAKNVGHASMGATNPRRIPSFAKIASRRRAMKSKKPGNGLCTRMRASTSVRKKPAGKKSRALAAPFVRPTWLHIISEFVIMKSHH